jgi:hypothetical protein
MAKAATKAVTTTGAAQLPAYLQDKAGSASGLQGLEMSDFIVPRIKLIQGTSDEPNTFDDAKKGEFWINVLDEPARQDLPLHPDQQPQALSADGSDGRHPQGHPGPRRRWRELEARARRMGRPSCPSAGGGEVEDRGRRHRSRVRSGRVRHDGPGGPESNPAASCSTTIWSICRITPKCPRCLLSSRVRRPSGLGT